MRSAKLLFFSFGLVFLIIVSQSSTIFAKTEDAPRLSIGTLGHVKPIAQPVLKPAAQIHQAPEHHRPLTLKDYWADPVLFSKLSSAAQNILRKHFGLQPWEKATSPHAATGRTQSVKIDLPASVSANVLVNNPADDTTPQDTQSETTIALNPVFNTIVSGYNDSGEFTGAPPFHFTGFSTSADGGSTFTDHGALPADPNPSLGDVGDPVLAVNNSNGDTDFTTLDFAGECLKFFKSTDGGITFSTPVCSTPGFGGTGDFQDKPWMAIDNSGGAFNGNIYIAWRNFQGAGPGGGIRLVRSTDGGTTFGPSQGTLIQAEGAFNVQGAFVAVGPDGAVYVAWLDQSAGGGTNNIIMARKSTDGGATFGAAATIAVLNNTAVNGELGLGGGFRTNAFPHMAIIPGGGFINEVDLVWNDSFGGDPADIYISQCPGGDITACFNFHLGDFVPSANDQFMPTIAITPNGNQIFWTYYDRRYDPGNSLIGRTGLILNAGISLLPAFEISTTTWPVVIGQDPVINATYMGDYDQAAADNSFWYVTWGDNRDPDAFFAHQPDVRFAKIPNQGPGAILSLVGSTVSGGNGNGRIDPHECNDLSITLVNNGTGDATGVSAVLSTSTPGVTVIQPNSAYPDIPVGGSASNITPFEIQTSAAFTCGTPVDLTLTVTDASGSDVVALSLPTGNDYAVSTSTGASIDLGTVDIGNHCDDCSTSITLPFSFTLYDQTFTAASVASNGSLQFLSADDTFTNSCLPFVFYNYAIAPHWDDLRTDGAGEGIFTSTVGSAPNRIFNIEWRTEYFCCGGTANFEIRLHETTNQIEFIYGTMTGGDGSTTIGLQKDTGSAFLNFSCGAEPAAGLNATFDLVTCGDAGFAGCVCPIITVSPGTFPDGRVSSAYSQTVLASGGTGPYTFSVSAGVLPNGLSLNAGTGAISGIPTTVETQTFTITATDSDGCAGSQTYTVNILPPCAAITLSPATLPGGSVGAAYSQTVSGSGGAAPYTFTVTAGALPAGLTLDPSTGVISGTPTSPGISSFIVTATDAVGCTGIQLYTVVIDCRTPGTLYGAVHGPGNFSPSTLVTIDRTTGATTTVGPIGFNSVSGIAFDASGKLYGAGLRASDGTPVILTIDPLTGAGTEVGPTGVVRISDLSFRSDGVLYAYLEPFDALGTVNLSTGAVTILGSTFDSCCGNGMAFSAGDVLYHAETLFPGGGAFLDTLDQTTGAGSFVVNLAFGPPFGVFPRINAMKFEPASGVLFGSAQDGFGGSGPYFLTTIDTITGVVTIIGPTGLGLDAIAFAPTGIQLSPKTLPGGNVTVPYGPQTITASGGTAPYTFTVTSGAMPNGLSLNPSTGIISGTPTTAGPFAFAITAQDAAGCTGSQLYVIDINAAPCPAITLSPATLPGGTLGFGYSQTVSASGGVAPYSYTVTSGALPAGLSLNSATGEIFGTPTAPGTTAFVITATDANGCIGSQLYTITIACPTITVSPSGLPNGSVGAAYSQTISASGGTGPYTFAVTAGTLPAGLSLSSASGVLSGTPIAPGISTFVVTATDALGCTGTQLYTVVINCLVPGLLYGSFYSGPNGPATLVTIDPSTGATTPIGPIGFNSVGALAFDPTGILYGAGARPGDGTRVLIRVNPVTGAGTEIGDMGIGPTGRITDMSFRSDGALYANKDDAGITTHHTGTIDVTTGLFTELGISGSGNCCGTGVAFSASGILYDAGNFEVDTLDQTTGAATPVAVLIFSPPLNVAPRINAMKFDPVGGVLFGSVQNGVGSFLTTVDPTTGVVTLIGPTVGGLDAIAFAPQGIQLLPKTLPGGNLTVPYSQTITASNGTAPYTFTLTSGALPGGLTLNPSTGVISGTPTTAGPFAFVITAMDATGCTGSQLYVFDINAAPCPVITLSPASLPAGTLGVGYSQTVSAVGGVTPYTFTVTTGALPAGLTLNPSTGEISGTPSASGTTAFVITATDANGCIGSQLYTITIGCPAITLAPPTLANGSVGTAYSDTISASGGTAPYTFTISAGALPPGISLDPVTGAITGTPTTQGTYSFVVTATDANGCSVSLFYSIQITCGGITVSPSGLPHGSVGAAYSQTISVTGGTQPFTFTVSAGSLPPGLSLDSETGLLSGTPSAPGVFTFEVTVTDANGCTGSQIYTVVIDCRTPGVLFGAVHGPGNFSPSTLVTIDRSTGATTAVGPIGFNSVSGIAFDASGKLYGAGLRASDGTPVILTIDPLTGAGTEVGPTGVVRISDLSFRSDGVLYAYLEPFDALGTVNLSTGAVTILGSTGDSCCGNGMAFSAGDVLYHAETLSFGGSAAFLDTLDQTTGAGSFVVNLTFGPPLGVFPRINAMKFEPASGVLFGSAQDGFSGSGSYFLTTIDTTTGVVTIIGPTALGLDAIAFAPTGIQLSPKTLPGGNLTIPYSQTITASNGTAPYTFSLTSGALPPGLGLNPATGVISGTPTAAGPFAFVITATDAAGCTGSQLYVIDINPAPCPVITLSPPSLPAGTLGFGYSQTVSANGGVAPYTFAVTTGTLPAGLSLDPNTGILSGTPTALGTTAFVITATDANGCIGSQLFSITIACPLITLAPPTLPNGTVGAPYAATVTASGGAGQSYTFTISAGALPPGVSLDPLTGDITGTPTAAGTYSFVVTATDANGCSGSLFYTIQVGCPAITVTPSGLPSAVLGVAYSQTISASGGTEPYTFSITAGALPPGLSLDPNTGEIAGTPTTTGIYTFEVTATDANGCTGRQTYTVPVNCAGITVSPETLPDGTTGIPYSQTVSASGGTGPYTFTVSAGSLPPGLSLNSGTGEISGVPATQGTFSFVISATDTFNCTASRFYVIRINCPVITVSPSSLPNGTTTVPYSQTLTASGGAAPYNFTVSAGSLPPGLSLNASTGVLDGTPTATGVFAFEVTATDANGCTATQLYAITVNLPACPTITLSPTSLPGGTIAVAYSQTISASGSAATPYVFTVSAGVLPPGLTLNPGTGVISGTPTTGGVFAFVVTARDTNDCAGSQLYTITIECPVITISPTSLPNGATGVAYSQTISATGSSTAITFAVTAGALPPGLTLNATTGVLSGTPTTAGTFAFTITATDANGCFASLSYLVSISCPVIDVSPSTLPGGVVGVGYSQTVAATGGTGPYSFAVSSGALPPGLSLSSSGLLSGVPALQGVFAFEITATDANGCAGTRLYLVAIGCATINVPPSLFPDAIVGTAYSQTISATGGTPPYNYAVTSGALPAGLTLNAATGEISGIPSAAGTYSFAVTATDANGCTGSWSYTIDAVCPAISLVSSLPDGTVGDAYSNAAAASGGTAPYAYAVSAGALPPGLTLDPSTGVISGTPTTIGDFSFTITATDFYNCSGSQSYSIHISPACLFCDDFEDGVLAQNWTYIKPSWNETGGELIGTPTGKKAIAVATPVWSGCSTCSVETTMQTAGGNGNRVWLLGWYQDKKNTVELLMKQESNAWILRQRAGGKIVVKAKFSEFINSNTLYKAHVVFNGTQFQLFINDVLALTMNAVGTPSGTVGFQVKNTVGKFEYITANN